MRRTLATSSLIALGLAGRGARPATAVLAIIFALSPLPAVAAGFDGDLVSLSVYSPEIIPADLLAYGTATVGSGVEFPNIAALTTPNLPPNVTIVNSSANLGTTTLDFNIPAQTQNLNILPGDIVFNILAPPNAPTISSIASFTTSVNLVNLSVSTTTPTSIDLHTPSFSLPAGETASANVSVNFVATPPPPPPPSKPPTQATQSAFWSRFLADTGTGLAISVAKATLRPVQAALTIVSALLLDASSHVALSEPVDLNYTTVAPPTPPPLPTIPPIPGISAATTAALDDLAENAVQTIGLANAIQTAVNRAQGAYVSDAPTYEALQLNADSTFFSEEGTDINNIAEDLISIGGGLTSVFNSSISGADFLAYQQQLATEGFPGF